MASPSLIDLPNVDPLAHTAPPEDPHSNFSNSSNSLNPNSSDSRKIPTSTNPMPVPILSSNISATPSQQRNNTRNLFTPVNSNTSLRGSGFNSSYPQNSAQSFDSVIQSSPLINLLRKNARNIRSWSEFFNFYCFQAPSWDTIGPKMLKNIRYFIYNYTIIYLAMLLFCSNLMPLLLTLVTIFLLLQFILLFQGERIYITTNISLSKTLVRLVVFFIFLIIFFITVIPVVFFLLASTCIVIAVHSALHIGQKYEKLTNESSFDDVV